MFVPEAALQMRSFEKVFWKYAPNYRRTSMPRLLYKHTEIILSHGCSPVILLHIFSTPFYKNTSGGLLLSFIKIFRFFWTENCLSNQKQSLEVFYKKDVLKYFVKTWKNSCQNLLFNKVSSQRPAILLKKRHQHGYFPKSFVKFLRKPLL